MFTSRIDRFGFLLGHVYLLAPLVIITFLYLLVSLTSGGAAKLPGQFHSAMNIVLFIVGLITTIAYPPLTIGLCIRRWHDMNQSGWMTLLTLLPIVGTFIYWALFFFRGTPAPNKYGLSLSPRDFDRVMFGPRPKDLLTEPIQPKYDQLSSSLSPHGDKNQINSNKI